MPWLAPHGAHKKLFGLAVSRGVQHASSPHSGAPVKFGNARNAKMKAPRQRQPRESPPLRLLQEVAWRSWTPANKLPPRTTKNTSFCRPDVQTESPVETEHIIFCAHPCMPSMGPFVSELRSNYPWRASLTSSCGYRAKSSFDGAGAPECSKNAQNMVILWRQRALECKQLLPDQSRKSHFKRLSLHKSSKVDDEELYHSAATLRRVWLTNKAGLIAVRKYASFGRAHGLTASSVETKNTIFCAH
eukprot:gene8253-biopygen13656